MDITKLLAPKRILFLEDTTKDAALRRLARSLARTEAVTSEKELLKAINDRERILSTGVGQGIAMPHAKISSVNDFVSAVGISKKGVPFDSLDGKPAHFIVMIAGPENRNEEYLHTMAAFMRILKPETTRQRLLAARNAAAVMEILQEAG